MSRDTAEEEPFRKIRLTLSEEAIDMLKVLREQAYFRSDSMVVEECIRAMYDVVAEISTALREAKGKKLSPQEQAIILQRIGIRVRRFMPIPKKIE